MINNKVANNSKELLLKVLNTDELGISAKKNALSNLVKHAPEEHKKEIFDYASKQIDKMLKTDPRKNELNELRQFLKNEKKPLLNEKDSLSEKEIEASIKNAIKTYSLEIMHQIKNSRHDIDKVTKDIRVYMENISDLTKIDSMKNANIRLSVYNKVIDNLSAQASDPSNKLQRNEKDRLKQVQNYLSNEKTYLTAPDSLEKEISKTIFSFNDQLDNILKNNGLSAVIKKTLIVDEFENTKLSHEHLQGKDAQKTVDYLNSKLYDSVINKISKSSLSYDEKKNIKTTIKTIAEKNNIEPQQTKKGFANFLKKSKDLSSDKSRTL